MATPLPQFDETHLRAVCDILGATNGPLSGTDIGELLSRCKIADPLPTNTKRYRLFDALNARQEHDRAGNIVAQFLQTAMNPVRFLGGREYYETLRRELNQALAFAGLELRDDGILIRTQAVRTLAEAESRASALRRKLIERAVHAEVLRFCRPELLDGNYFHGVLEAAKSVAARIRDKTGLASDGADLIDQAFGRRGGNLPLLAFNSLQSESERSEHSGLMNLMKGIFGAFRNPTAHESRLLWSVSEEDALDILSMISLVHRRLDTAVSTTASRKSHP